MVGNRSVSAAESVAGAQGLLSAESLMQAQVEVERWIFVGETIRFTGGFRANDKVFAGVWESRSPDGTLWQPLMDVTLRKVE